MRDAGGEAAQAGASAVEKERRPAGAIPPRAACSARWCRRKVGDSPTLICSPRGVRKIAQTLSLKGCGLRSPLTMGDLDGRRPAHLRADEKGMYGGHTLGVFLG
jgi:hypothetical protein